MDVTSIISDSLSPVVIISGLGLLIFGMNNRLISVGSRVRQLNKELREIVTANCLPQRALNIQQQLSVFIQRALLLQNAIFLLFGALGMMILTTFAIALLKLKLIFWGCCPLWTFLSGLILIFLAVLLEGFETILNIKTLSLDVAYNASIRSDVGNIKS
jgi:hypothetical protein